MFPAPPTSRMEPFGKPGLPGERFQQHRERESTIEDDLESHSTATAPFPEYSELEAERTRMMNDNAASGWETTQRSVQTSLLPKVVGKPREVKRVPSLLQTIFSRNSYSNDTMLPSVSSSDVMRGMLEMNARTSTDGPASSPIHPTMNYNNHDVGDSMLLVDAIKQMRYGPSSGASLLPNIVPTTYQAQANVQNRSSSSHGSSSHSSKPSSAGSAIVNPMRNEQMRVSSDFMSYNMHASELSHDNVHVRSARELVSDSTASSMSGGINQFYGGQHTAPSYISGSRPATSGAESFPPGPNARSAASYPTWTPSSISNAIWGPNASNFYGGPAPVGGAPGLSTAVPGNFANPSFVPEPVHMYRATTYPPVPARGPTSLQRTPGYGPSGFTQGQGVYNNYGLNKTGYGPIGSRLNANATEFNHEPYVTESYNPSHLGKHVYLSHGQPINWRQLLEPGVTADWDLIVDKIISNNDQQASIFLQQKIKNSETMIKDNIIKSIIKRGLELMGNRFGNFLIQRVFECANHAQIMGLARHIEGHTVRLSTDAFGCHVIQKAFDCVPEAFKHQMVRELLTRIRDTIVHRYACHVWQKLFELRWQGPPPMIMGTVNAALIGQWTQVAVGETGSLVVQNIFENCNEEDKRPCIDEVLNNLDYIARGQYGNWCIQHICEHGTPNDRDVAISMVLARAADYSMDQYASKCIEKCLKVCGADFLDRYLEQVLMRCPGENFSPLVQIARDQYGNFLIQWILNNAGPHLRDIVQAEIRKHLVSLRGNKYGSKVALTCGYGPQGVRPGVPFAPAHHRHNYLSSRGPTQQLPVPNHSTSYGPQYQYGQVDGAVAAPHPGNNAPYYQPPNPPFPPSTYGPSQAGTFNHY